VTQRLVVLLCVLASTVYADDRKAAESYFRAGAKAYAAQNFLAAAQNFDEAYKAAPIPEIAFSAAQAYRRLYRVEPRPEHVKRAVELYKAYLAVVKKGGRVGDAADNLAEMERELERVKVTTPLAPAAAKTRIGVSVTLADQRASDSGVLQEVGDATGELTHGLVAMIDGAQVEPFALVDVAPKEHVISVSADGYLPVEKKTVAVDGASQIVEIELQPKPASVTVKTESGARISVDGRAQTSPLSLAAGKHLLTIVHRGREPAGKELVVARGDTLTIDAPLAKTAKRRAVPWVLGGAGLLAAGAITTSIVAIVHDGRASDLRDGIDAGNRPARDGDRYDAEVRSRDRYTTASWALGGTAVVAGAVGVLLYLFDTPAAEGVHVSPVIGGASGVVLGGTF
jgi:hypothetical protein